MSRTTKPGKRLRTLPLNPDPPGVSDAIEKRHRYGRTEKIRRRNRKIWTRLGNKRRRRADAEASKQ